MNDAWRWIGLAGALAGLSGVILGAIGSHAVPSMDDPLVSRVWQTAIQMHLFHAAALLGLATLERRSRSRWFQVSSMLMVTGLLLFCGSLYFRVLSGADSSGWTAPVGGMLLIGGWAVTSIGVLWAGKFSED